MENGTADILGGAKASLREDESEEGLPGTICPGSPENFLLGTGEFIGEWNWLNDPGMLAEGAAVLVEPARVLLLREELLEFRDAPPIEVVGCMFMEESLAFLLPRLDKLTDLLWE